MHPDSMLISGVFASKLDQLILMSLLLEQMSDVASTALKGLIWRTDIISSHHTPCPRLT
jgi:hypothetical protein